MNTHLEDLLQKFELSKWVSQLKPFTKNSIRLIPQRVNEQELTLGTSKFGGLPDFPPNIEWPIYKDRPLSLLAQLNLKEIPAFEARQYLPSSGILYFFYDPEQEPWGFDPAWRGGWQVFYSPTTYNLNRTAAPLYNSPIFSLVYPCCAIEYSQEISLPSWEGDAIEQLGLTEEEIEHYFELVNEGIFHRLLGHPSTIQGEMEGECQLVSNGIYLGKPIDYSAPHIQALLTIASDWQLLLQFDTDEITGFDWGAQGRLYFWIQQQALVSCDFTNSWLVGQCT